MRRGLFPILLLAAAVAAVAEDTKSLPNQAGNSQLGLDATAITDRKEITDLLGVDLGDGYVVVKMKATPQAGEPLRFSLDDFTLISRKNGERSGAFSPDALAGSTVLIVQPTFSDVRSSNVGMGMPLPVGGKVKRAPQQTGIGTGTKTEGGKADPKLERSQKEDPRLKVLEAKVFPEIESKDPVEGLLYFTMDTKSKPKDLGLIYTGQAGRLVIDFK